MARYGRHRRVLVLGDDTRSFLAVIRSLGRFGVEVHVAGCSADAPALSSAFVTASHTLPRYESGDEQWLAGLTRLLSDTPFDLVVPCSDETILPLQRHRDELAEFPLMLVPAGAFQVFSDKERTHSLARTLAVPVPEQAVAGTVADAEQIAGRFGYPVVLKPRSSFTLNNLRTKQRVVKVWGPEDLRSQAATMLTTAGLILERHVAGVGEGVEVICADGEVLSAFQHRRVHEPLHGGGSSYRVSVPLHAGMLEAVRRLMAATRYTGVGMVEFKTDPGANKWTLIEVNPRFWGSLSLSIAAGLDFPRYAYEFHVTGQRNVPKSYRTGVYARHWTSDLQWIRANLRADRSNPILHTRPLVTVAGELLRIPMGREVSDTWAWDDPRPALAEIRSVVATSVTPKLRRLWLMRRAMQARARAALGRARAVAVVCKGNICRSPFAAQLLAERCQEVAVASAGLLPLRGRIAPEEGCSAAREYGIDLTAHRSSVLCEELVTSTDLILIFDEEHERLIRARFPQALPKVHFWGALNAKGPLQIEDPYGKSVEAFRACYRDILNALGSPGLTLGHRDHA